jgi:hypothetical protein
MPTGQLKDISCRDLLRDLDKAGRIKLPPTRHISRIVGAGPEKVERIEHCTDRIETDLRQIAPIRIEIANTKDEIKLFKSYIAQYHYIGFDRSIGENIKYIVRSAENVPLACMMFGSAAWKCRPRDAFIGWSDAQKRIRLQYITNNMRNLIFPWVRVAHLASHILGGIARRISRDWYAKYGHPIYLLETFVERDRFRGVCYSASNWVNVGTTTGRGRNSTSTKATLPKKDVWLLPICRSFREKMCEDSAP